MIDAILYRAISPFHVRHRDADNKDALIAFYEYQLQENAIQQFKSKINYRGL